ncbi:FtsK/SpoIIIE domain-containing protein [Ornithinimicrobium pekingense]|uniref:FHA domain-containing protein n=1 Tax=Ornithinimicrobium pekingense TaxID=384677 RepID=A0ABQ2F6F7_9MICO|nr:FtsK/SpoIIIE domain-containing protein [Ornithinimicrobium pekingense]GGK64309.1 hypothetical protein GCM10011509_10850 [Ornithinimicrobium pekingense]
MVTAPGGRGPRHLIVRAPDTATVDDLHRTLGLPAPGGSVGHAPLRHGYAAGPAPSGTPPSGPAHLVVTAGPDAGASVPLRPGRWVTVGRAASCELAVDDPRLSRRHLRVRHERSGVVVQDLGSTNGLRWVGLSAAGPDGAPSTPTAMRAGVRGEPVPWPAGSGLEVGASRLELLLEPLPPAVGRDRGGRLLVTPWPRQPSPLPRQARFSTPPEPQRREVRAPSAWVWALPLLASVVVAGVLRMPMVLLFGLMAPTMVLGHHLGERRSARLDHVRAVRHRRRTQAVVDASAAQALTDELSTLRHRHPGLAGVVTSLVPRPTTGLWSRSVERPEVVIGEGEAPSGVELDGAPLQHAAAPLVLDLGEPVTVAGPRGVRDALVRGWILQLACGHSPAALSLAVERASLPGTQWDLLAWLPHTRRAPGVQTGTQVVWGGGDGLLLLDDLSQAPPASVQVLVESAVSAVLRRPGQEEVRFRPTLVSLPLARSLARRLAEVDADEGSGPRDGRHRTVALGDLLPWPVDADEVRRSWSSPQARLRTPIGTDDQGAPFEVDLARDGPHALVAGTTGSGKSELLRTLVTGLALRNPPSALALLLVDYKGGSSLGECASLPHCTGLVTDLDPHLAERVLVSLRAELQRRESVLARAGVRDVGDHVGADLPRLLVVVDEFRVLTEELPEFLTGLVRLAAVGRSLGVHLVLATQRPAGVVSADLRANVNLRIALRVRDASDSLDVLEAPDAAGIPEGVPGRALLRTGSAPPRGVHVAPAAPAAVSEPDESWHVEEVDGVWGGWAALHAAEGEGHVGSGLGALPDLLARVAADDGHRASRVWLPPLGTNVTAATTGVWAVADRPDEQRHEPLAWDAAGHVGVVGAPRSGRTTAARSLLAAAGAVWVYVVDPARGLAGSELSAHPGLRAYVGPHDPAHAARVLEVVNEVIDARLALGSGSRPPPVVLLVDGWDRFVDVYGDADRGRARDLALRVLRDGPAAGVVALLTGDRSLLLGTVASALPETWALRLNDRGDLALAGLRTHEVPTEQPPGRAVRTSDALVAQVLQPADDGPDARAPLGDPPPRVVTLPTGRRGPATTAWAVGGDGAEDLEVPPAPFLVLGPPGSGVSTTLAVLAAPDGAAVLHVGPEHVADPDEVVSRLGPAVTTLVVDDAHLVTGTRLEEVALAWAERGGRLLVGAELEASGSLFRGLVPYVARHRRGLVLQPGTAAHGSVLGVRLPVGDRPVPGRGVLVDRGRCTRVQVLPVSRPDGPPRPDPPACP